MSARTRALLSRRRTAAAAALLLLGALGLAGCTDDAAGPPDPPATTAAAAGRPGRAHLRRLRLARRGRGLRRHGQRVQLAHRRGQVTVEVLAHPRRGDGRARSPATLPDVFLISRRDLAAFQADGEVQPVDELPRRARRRLRRRLLPRRAAGVQPRQPAAVHALRHLADGHLLQHRARRLRADAGPRAARPPGRTTSDEPPTRWTFEQFSAAAEFATRPRQGTQRRLDRARRLRGLAPFIVAGDGSVFDDDTDPTSLAFSGENSGPRWRPRWRCCATPR